MNNNQLAAASHLGWIIPIPCLVTALIYFNSTDNYVRDHARQGLFYQVLALLVGLVVLGFNMVVFSILPSALVSVLSLLIYAVFAVLLIPAVMGAIAAFQIGAAMRPPCAQPPRLRGWP